MDKTGKTLSKIISYLLVVLLCLGIAGGVITLIQKLTEDKGLYVEYDGKQYFSGTDGITITSKEFNFVDLYLCNTEDWEDYSVSDYTVRIVPYNTDDYDFYYSVGDTRYSFSSTADLSAGFTYDYADYDGNGLQVSDDGAISFYVNNIVYASDVCNMKSFLTYVWYHSLTSSSDRVALLTSYPDFTTDYCFAITVTSPDGETALEVPFRLNVTDVPVEGDEEDSSGGSSGSSSDGSSSGSGTSSSEEDSGTTDSSEDSSSEDSSSEDSSGTDVSGDDEEEEDPAAITYNLYNVTAQCDLPSTIDEITDDKITLTFAVNNGYHMSDCYCDSSDGTTYVTTSDDGGAWVGRIHTNCDAQYSYVVADETVTIVITACELTSGFTLEVGAEKTHYIYLDFSGCYLSDYISVSGYDFLFYDTEYLERDPICVKYYYSYYHAELYFCEEDGYSFWYYTDDSFSGISYDNYSYSFSYTGDISYVSYSCDGWTSLGVCFGVWDRTGYSDDTDWSITIHITCYEEVVYEVD